MTAVMIDIRRLDLSDLDAIEAIELRAYPTPWSRAMFASELAKPTSICLGAFEGRELVGYIVNSRYVDAWHVMNVAVDPDRQRRGIASRLLGELFELTHGDERRGYTLEVRVSNDAAIRLYERLGFEPRGIRRGYYTDNREDALIMWRDAGRVILGIETSCDETAAAIVTTDGDIVASVVASQAELHARFGGVVPEVASRRHLELVVPVVSDALARAGTALDDVETIGVTTHPGLIGALLVGVSAAKTLAWSRRLPLAPVDHLHGHVASLYLKPLDLEPPFVCLLASGGHTMLLDVSDRTGFSRRLDGGAGSGGAGSEAGLRVLGTTLDDAAGEAFDKGARLLGLGYPGGPALDALAQKGDAAAFDFPVARVPDLDFSFSGVKTALLYAVRDLAPEDLEARKADLAAAYQRAIVTALVERVRATGAERVAVVGGVAANSELRAALADAALAPLALCTDNAAMIASAARYVRAVPYPDYLSLDARASA